MASLPPGYRVRAPRPEDLDRVADVLVAAQLADDGVSDFEADWLRGEWTRPRLDLSTDAWVVTDREGAVAGYAQAFDEDAPEVLESFGTVHPGHRGLGIGGVLVDLVDARGRRQAAGTRGPVRIHNGIPGPDAAARELLGSRGYSLVRHFFHMHASLAGRPGVPPRSEGQPSSPGENAGPAAPRGVLVREVDPERDAEAVHGVLERAFRDHWGYVPRGFGEWAEDRLREGMFEPGLWFLAELEGRPVGAVTGTVLGGKGWVGDLGVLREQRGRGIGACLLRSAFAAFASRGVTEAMLNVDAANLTGAVRLYERVGMSVRRRWDLYEKVLAGAPGEAGSPA